MFSKPMTTNTKIVSVPVLMLSDVPMTCVMFARKDIDMMIKRTSIYDFYRFFLGTMRNRFWFRIRIGLIEAPVVK